MTKIKDLHSGWRRDGEYRAAYDGLDEEFRLARALIEARTAAALSQAQLARRMKTSQSYIARISAFGSSSSLRPLGEGSSPTVEKSSCR